MSNDIYLIEDASDRIGDSALLQRWRELLAESESHERVYQSPEFFDYLRSTATHRPPPQLFTVTERASRNVVGVVPLVLRRRSFDFNAGRLRFGSLPVESVALLGSAPLMPVRPGLLNLLFEFLLEQFPKCHAISLTSLQADSRLWNSISNGTAKHQRGYRPHLLNNWRECHRIPLPENFEAFLAQFGSKRRYNLKRQQRQLREHGGGRLDLRRIERPEQLEAMYDALSKLSTPEHRAQLWTFAEMLKLAQRGMLLCYQVDCGEAPCALILGLRSSETLYLFNIFHDATLDQLSVGTTSLHMAIEDLCDRLRITCIDLGYGTPGHTYQSTNVTVRRAHVLLMRPNWRNRLACGLHHQFTAAVGLARRRLR